MRTAALPANRRNRGHPESPPPELSVEATVVTPEGWHVQGLLRSPRGAPSVQLAFPAQRAPEAVSFDGVEVPADLAPYPLFDPAYDVYTVWTLPPEGIAVERSFRGGDPVTLFLVDRSYQLPDAARQLSEARSLRAVPVALGDATLVSTTLTLAAPARPAEDAR